MTRKKMTSMELEGDQCSSDTVHDLWPLDNVDPKKAKFPCCIVWTPLPIVSWLAPYMGHVGICREDGVVLDFSGSNFVGTDDFSFGSVARYLQLDREQRCYKSLGYPLLKNIPRGLRQSWKDLHQMGSLQQARFVANPSEAYNMLLGLFVFSSMLVLDTSDGHGHQYGPLKYMLLGLSGYPTQCCFPPNLAGHTCGQPYQHATRGTAISWDDALRLSVQRFHHKNYNLFTCNCHSFVASCLNLLAYNGSTGWNVLSIAAMLLWRGRWVDGASVVRSFAPFMLVLVVGIFMAGWSFVIGLAAFSFLLLGWNVIGVYCLKTLIE